MKKRLVNLKNFWQDRPELKIIEKRELIEYLVEKKIEKESRISTKLVKFIKRILS